MLRALLLGSLRLLLTLETLLVRRPVDVESKVWSGSSKDTLTRIFTYLASTVVNQARVLGPIEMSLLLSVLEIMAWMGKSIMYYRDEEESSDLC
jgi:hypothetical protein